MKNTLRYIFLSCLLIICASAFPNSATLRGLSVADGLSDLTVNALYKDSLGFVWIGTGTSLDCFNGVYIRHYPVGGTNEKRKRVNAIAELPGNQIWMGNGMGLWRVSRYHRDLERIVPEKIDCAVNALLYDGDSTLYIGSEKGLFISQGGNLEQVLIDQNALSDANVVTGLSLDEQGVLWMTTQSGLHSLRLSDRTIQTYHNVADGRHICHFTCIARIGPTLYLGTMDRGIIAFDTRSRQFSQYVSVGCNVIMALSTDGDHLLHVGTDGNGVHFIDTTAGTVVRTLRHEADNSESLRSNSVYSLLVDRDGLVWVGFYQLGLDYTLYQSDLFTTYDFPPHFHSKDMPIRALAIRGSEKVIGSRDGLFYIDERRGRFKNFKSQQLRSDMIFCIVFHEGEYYVGTYGGGMYVFNPATLDLRDFCPAEPRPFNKGHIFCMEHDEEQTLWVGTSEGVYCYKDGSQTAHYTNANSRLPKGNVYEIYFDSTRKGWICTENGVCLWDPSSGTMRTDIFPEGFIDKEKIRVIYEDSEHRLYFFPDKGPLFVSDLAMSSFHRLQPGTPLEGRDGMFITEDSEHWLWMGTNDGLFRFDKQDTFIPFDYDDGIPSSTFTLCTPVTDELGRLWFGNTKGLLSIDVARVSQSLRNFYPVRITDVFVNGKAPALHESSDMERHGPYRIKGSNVTFFFSEFSYTALASMSYEYQLQGFDEGWVSVTGQSEATYYDLPSGTYTFRVRRTGQPDTEAQLQVEIASTFSGWTAFALSVAVLLALGGYMVYRRKANQDRMYSVNTSPASQEEKYDEKYKRVRLTPEECKRLTEQLEKVMRDKQPYKQPDLKIADLAKTVGISAHTLSYLFNQHLERNYYDYINDFRIAEFKRLVDKGESDKYSLDALTELCGFNSRASFFRYFKKTMGITPNEYIKSKEKTI